MSSWWIKQATRINALSLRERLFLFISLLTICLALADVAWLSPAQSAHKQALQKLDKQNEDLKKSTETMKSLGDTGGSVKTLNGELSAVKKQIEQVNQSIVSATSGPVDDKPLAQVLVHLLRRYEGLALVTTSSMTPELTDKKILPDTAGSSISGLTRQGVELTVSGPYSQLVQYVQTLETAMPHIRWGTMKLKSEKQPPELILQLFIVGVSP
jgi:MSHA biogenesis protein MshJ